MSKNRGPRRKTKKLPTQSNKMFGAECFKDYSHIVSTRWEKIIGLLYCRYIVRCKIILYGRTCTPNITLKTASTCTSNIERYYNRSYKVQTIRCLLRVRVSTAPRGYVALLHFFVLSNIYGNTVRESRK